MIPRGAPYIGWTDLLAAASHCAGPDGAEARQRSAAAVEGRWAPNSVACLSVRSGLDTLLSVLALPAESEVIVSAITIPHILDILAHHGLVAVPVDINPDTLAIDAAEVERALTPRTKAILIAHLFGSRMPLDAVAAVAQKHGLLLLEDCAQANDGSAYRGHAASDVSFFSFGFIKRQTAMGGALLTFTDAALAARVRARQAEYSAQTQGEYFRRVLTMTAIKAAANRTLFDLFVLACRLLGRDHDATLGRALRGFSKGDLLVRLRHQPAVALLKTLERRLRQSTSEAVAARVGVVRGVVSEYPGLRRAGARAAHHSHWQFPALSTRADALLHHLWKLDIDATRGASNLCFVPAPPLRPAPTAAIRLMDEVIYLPLCPTATGNELRAIAHAVRDFETAG